MHCMAWCAWHVCVVVSPLWQHHMRAESDFDISIAFSVEVSLLLRHWRRFLPNIFIKNGDGATSNLQNDFCLFFFYFNFAFPIIRCVHCAYACVRSGPQSNETNANSLWRHPNESRWFARNVQVRIQSHLFVAYSMFNVGWNRCSTPKTNAQPKKTHLCRIETVTGRYYYDRRRPPTEIRNCRKCYALCTIHHAIDLMCARSCEIHRTLHLLRLRYNMFGPAVWRSFSFMFFFSFSPADNDQW